MKAALCALLALPAALAGAISADDAAARTFDYVVVGGGLGGLVVASRLSEDPNVSVLCVVPPLPTVLTSPSAPLL